MSVLKRKVRVQTTDAPLKEVAYIIRPGRAAILQARIETEPTRISQYDLAGFMVIGRMTLRI